MNLQITILVVVAMIMTIGHINAQTCLINNGMLPASGACLGPLQRAVVRLSSSSTNQECPPNQVRFNIDGDESRAMCGECVPGTSGIESPGMCGMNEYCNDNGVCTSLQSHPLLDSMCPQETDNNNPTLGWCGPGLHCYSHRCQVCLEGSVDNTDGKMCIKGEWTYSSWDQFKYAIDPTTLFIFIIFLLVALYIVYSLSRSLLPNAKEWKSLGRWVTKKTKKVIPTKSNNNNNSNFSTKRSITKQQQQQQQQQRDGDYNNNDNDYGQDGADGIELQDYHHHN
ncbi:hypothetical protein DFA_00707 [Cavenderia fasciculata]|uniref:Uncharacterized protein n=1 Tax=Cavenderia fasciculata TaxID=261658 RepID=F4PTA6_CACFS|nr:uncharacterized protein DFA_00707 [Cavenderia fasciculata]EGG20842.1 hypothetical protein DFA_00707 [Cavenderia fasciculata]|eukprot:XP_004358692.1 hypothetical protein DFA_00707 [Cavenderia fasciculata]